MTATARIPDRTIHASAVKVGDTAVLIRGPSGSGKSRLAFDLMLAGRAGQLPPAVLVGDDRVHLARRDDRLMVRPPPALAGLIEIRGLGIRRCDHVADAVVGLVVDLDAADAGRLPVPESLVIELFGFMLPRIPVAAGFHALPLVAGFMTTTDARNDAAMPPDCRKEFGNHIEPTIATKSTRSGSPHCGKNRGEF
ncbi:MAG: HPr kinase/phosphatase C-terminal domain-containing protein [Xanthobacteraceae bacterium]|nr:HPr kinase/phosphatase C-terminal domain-containing protein [Xanthobacteraceae bacterium]